ncbi:H-NS family nucleoid-associated regulatory protein [Orbaceae bacterium ac157xtp]
MAKKIVISNNFHTIRSQMKTVSVNQLQSIIEKLELVLKEKIEFEKLAKLNAESHNQKLEAYLTNINEENIDSPSIETKNQLPTFKKIRKRRTKRPAKYKYHDEYGIVRTWTGQGRTPKPIHDILKKNPNKRLDDFLI